MITGSISGSRQTTISHQEWNVQQCFEKTNSSPPLTAWHCINAKWCIRWEKGDLDFLVLFFIKYELFEEFFLKKKKCTKTHFETSSPSPEMSIFVAGRTLSFFVGGYTLWMTWQRNFDHLCLKIGLAELKALFLTGLLKWKSTKQRKTFWLAVPICHPTC